MQNQSDLACSQLITLVSDNYIDSFITDALNADIRKSPVARALRTNVRKLVGPLASEMTSGGRLGRALQNFTPSEAFLTRVRTGLAESDSLTMHALQAWSEAHYDLGRTLVDHLSDGHAVPVLYPDIDQLRFRGWWKYEEYLDESQHFAAAYPQLASPQARGLMLVYVSGMLISPPEVRSASELPSFFSQTFVQIGGTTVAGGGPGSGSSAHREPESSAAPTAAGPGQGPGGGGPPYIVEVDGPAGFDIEQVGTVVAAGESVSRGDSQENAMESIGRPETNIVEHEGNARPVNAAEDGLTSVTKEVLDSDLAKDALEIAKSQFANQEGEDQSGDDSTDAGTAIAPFPMPGDTRWDPGSLAIQEEEEYDHMRFPSPLSSWLEHLQLLPDIHPAWDSFDEFVKELAQAATGRKARTQQVLELRLRIEQMQDNYAEEMDALRITAMVPEGQNGPKDLQEAASMLRTVIEALEAYRRHTASFSEADTDIGALREMQRLQSEMADRVYGLFQQMSMLMRLTLDDPDERAQILSEPADEGSGSGGKRRRRRRRGGGTTRKVTVSLEESRDE